MAIPHNPMAKVKLDLQGKDDNTLRLFATAHKSAMNLNVNFSTPLPNAAVFDPVLTAYGTKLDAIETAEIALRVLRQDKAALRKSLEAHLTTRGDYVDSVALGDAAKIQSAGFEIQADGSPTTSLPQPQNCVATAGDDEGEADVACDAVARSKSYIFQCREHPDDGPPGAWQQAKVSSRSSTTITGLISGKKYAFRMRAVGPNEVESPWSDEAVCRVP